MELRRDDFPVALQAYDLRSGHEDFVAEQVVSTQSEADSFMSLYAGRLIKTRTVRPVETQNGHVAKSTHHRRAGVSPWIFILLLIVVALIIAYATGYLQIWIDKIK
jgi:hypothetical protein